MDDFDIEAEEIQNLQIEFEWVMREEVYKSIKNIHDLLVDCARRFPIPLCENGDKKTEKLVITSSQDQLKCNVTLIGDSITQADVSFKVKRASNQTQRTSITPDVPWKLQQIQDAGNHLRKAVEHIENVNENHEFKSSEEVIKFVQKLIGSLLCARNSLISPKKKSVDELMKGRNMKSLVPNLPEDQAISFFLQCHSFVIAVYQVVNIQGAVKMEAVQAETTLDWLNEVLVLLTISLARCQQLKDKIEILRLDLPLS